MIAKLELNPTDEEVLNCDWKDMCKFTEYNDCMHRKRCDKLQLEKLRNEINEIIQEKRKENKDV